VNFELIGNLVRLRYKLLWAKTRSRNGRIALFMAGYLLVVLLIAVLASGGLGAALVAVRTGKAELVARAGALRPVRASRHGRRDTGLRRERYLLEAQLSPLSAESPGTALGPALHRYTRPLLVLILALEFGLVVGLYVASAASFWLGWIAVLLLFVSNYFLRAWRPFFWNG